MVLSASTPSSVRHNYGQIADKLEVGNLIQTQLDSFAWFCREGLRELFDEINPITDYTGKNYELRFLDYEFGDPQVRRGGVPAAGHDLLRPAADQHPAPHQDR